VNFGLRQKSSILRLQNLVKGFIIYISLLYQHLDQYD